MPMAVAKAGIVEKVLSLDAIAPAISKEAG
jgi:chemotaxis response regulator CheB